MKKKVLKIHPKDNVLVALENIKTGEVVYCQDQSYVLKTDVKIKHKFATMDFKVNDSVFMYGVKVGRVTKEIKKGEVITTDNLIHDAQDYTNQKEDYKWDPPNVNKFKNKSFMGYYREDGSVGTANYWIFIPMVFCENKNLDLIKESILNSLGYQTNNIYQDYTDLLVDNYKDKKENFSVETISIPSLAKKDKIHPLFENIDGIKFLTHNGGCGETRGDTQALCSLLAGYINHPNVAGATVLSLGCQHAQVSILKEELKKRNPDYKRPLFVFEQQSSPSEHQMIIEAIKITFKGLIEANKQKREAAGLDKLVIGMECGASDGFSGISSNPVIGRVSDLIVALGGSTILSEFPELCGVEQELINRCNNQELANRFFTIMDNYKKAAAAVGASLDMNPSPGNIKDGLITDAIKSAGAAKKGGESPINDVLRYPEAVKEKGLNLLCTPGNDVESTTGMAGSGANLILFSTGLGTPTGNPITPVIKLASNTELAERLSDIIDFDTGKIILGEKTIEEVGEALLEYCIEVASGEPTKSMLANKDDFLLWKTGVSL